MSLTQRNVGKPSLGEVIGEGTSSTIHMPSSNRVWIRNRDHDNLTNSRERRQREPHMSPHVDTHDK